MDTHLWNFSLDAKKRYRSVAAKSQVICPRGIEEISHRVQSLSPEQMLVIPAEQELFSPKYQWRRRLGRSESEGFNKGEATFNLPCYDADKRMSLELSPQYLMLKAQNMFFLKAKKNYERKATEGIDASFIDELYSRGWRFTDKGGNRKGFSQHSLFNAWLMASLIEKEKLAVKYYNPGGNFFVKVPSKHLDPNESRHHYSIILENMPVAIDKGSHFATWMNINAKSSITLEQKIQSPTMDQNPYREMGNRYTRKEKIFDDHELCAMILRTIVADSRTTAQRQHKYPNIVLTLTPPLSQGFIDYGFTLRNCVIREYFSMEKEFETADGEVYHKRKKAKNDSLIRKRRLLSNAELEIFFTLRNFEFFCGKSSQCYIQDDTLVSAEKTIERVYTSLLLHHKP